MGPEYIPQRFRICEVIFSHFEIGMCQHFKQLILRPSPLLLNTTALFPSLFIYRHGSITTFLLVYVDDILLTGTDASFLTSLTKQLDQLFSVKDLGHISFFLGMQASPAPDGLLLTQSHYIESILHKANMHNSQPCSTPLAVGLQLSQHEGEPMSDPILYRQIVGALQYATITRPYICFAVNRVSQFMHSPREPHWAAVKRILRYLRGTA